MSKKPIDYSKNVIYKLVHKDDLLDINIYIGSTSNLVKRKYTHKCSCLKEGGRKYNLKIYSHIRENGGWEEWNMVPVEEYPCKNKKEAEAREEFWRCHFNAKLNTIRAHQSDEIQQELDNIYKERKKKKYWENREQVLKYFSQKITCSCGHIGTKNNISKHLKTQKHLNAIIHIPQLN
jgi:hypothetical protein